MYRGKFEINISVPLALEYEEIGKRAVGKETNLKTSDVDDILDYVCSVAHRREIYYLWRPILALMTEEYLEQRAKRGSRKKFQRAMAKVPKAEPEFYGPLPE